MIALLLLLQDVVLTTAPGPRVGAPDWVKPGETREIAGRKIAFVAEPGASADAVVWISELDREKALARLKELKGVHLAICSGRGTADVEPLRVGESWLLPAPGSANAEGRVELVFRDGRLADVRAGLRAAATTSDAARRLAASKGVAAPPPAALEAASRALRLSARGVAERPRYAGLAGPALVVDLELENLIPLALVKENKVPVQYKVLNLADHLYLVVDGRRVERLKPESHDWPGHLPLRGLTLDRQGARLRGNAVFDAGTSTSLDLRFYDFAHGHVRLPLKGTAPEEKPVAPPARNEAVEMAVFGVKREGGLLKVDLRGRSLIEIDADATAFDPKAAPGTRFKMGTVADWTEARRHLQLVVDGELALASADYPDAPRYLPDLFTGDIASFKLPEKAASLELRCDFPNAAFPDGRVIRPKGLTILLEGQVPAETPRPAIAKIDDGVFQVEIVGQTLEKGRLALDVVVRNTGASLEMFQTREQLKAVTEKGAQVAMDPSSFDGPRAPLPLLGVPPGGRRSFHAVFRLPEGDRRPRLAYAGVTKAEIVALKAVEAKEAAEAPSPKEPKPAEAPPQKGAKAAPAEAPPQKGAKAGCPSCKAAVEPADKFCAGCGSKLK